MSFTGGGRRPLTRSVCAATRACNPLHKHRCTLDHASPILDLVFPDSQSPISRLSNEELLLIFEEAINSTFADPATFVPPWKPALIVTISNVCRRWRGIAFSNSCLWTHILACSLSEVERHLYRSATRPLVACGTFQLNPKVAPGYSAMDGDSTAIANALVKNAHRWKIFHWHDGSANGASNVLRLMNSPNAYSMLECLVLRVHGCAPSGSMDTANANAAVLFPALKQMHLTGVHPMFLPHSPMPALQNLKLEGLNDRLLFSQLFCLLYRSPALRTLNLHLTFPAIDVLESIFDPSPRVFPNSPPYGTLLTLPHLVCLSLNPAPAAGFRHLFGFLDLPALQHLDLHMYASPHTTYWPILAPNGRAVRLPFHHPEPLNVSVVPLPALRVLHVTYCTSAALTPDAPPELPQLRTVIFPALTDLQITHLFVPSPGAAQVAGMPPLLPPPQPLRRLDELFHTPFFTHVRRLTLIGCALPLRMLCDALLTRFPALEGLALCACPGAGPLVCALAPGECGGGCERPGSGNAWIGMKVREVVVKECGDVRVGCLRKVIEARLREGRTMAAPSLSGSVGGGDAGAASASGPEATGAPSARSGEPAVGSDWAGEVVAPQRLVVVQVLDCARVTREDACALAAVPGAPTVVWTGSGGEHELSVPGAAASDVNGSA